MNRKVKRKKKKVVTGEEDWCQRAGDRDMAVLSLRVFKLKVFKATSVILLVLCLGLIR